MQELLDQVERPDAVFVTNHLMTLGVLQAIAQAKLAIPADIAVVSFDDMSWAPLLQTSHLSARPCLVFSARRTGSHPVNFSIRRAQPTVTALAVSRPGENAEWT